MFKNYFYLSRNVGELKNNLIGSQLVEIYSQEKNILFLSIPKLDLPHRHLIISTNPQFPYLLIKNNHRKAKINVVNFFSDNLPSTIQNIEIAKYERVLKITLNNSELFFIIRGNMTNVYFIDKLGGEQYFKKTNKYLTREIISLSYTSIFSHEDLDYDSSEYETISDIKKNYPMISSEIKNELLLRSQNVDHKDDFSSFKEIVKDILLGDIRVGYNSDLGKLVFIPNAFGTIETDISSKLFKDVNSALHYYIASYYKEASKNSLMKNLAKYFDKEFLRLTKTLNTLRKIVNEGSHENEYYRIANCLLGNIQHIKKGSKEIKLSDFESGDPLLIKLDPKLSAQDNINRYFEKAKDEKVNFKKSLELFNFTKRKFEETKNQLEIFENSKTVDELKTLSKEILPDKKNIIKMDTGLKFKYWHYIINDKYNVYVGKDSKSNDYLSIKFAKQNDYWFHARGLPGSHVVLRVENKKEVVPKDVIKKGASIAAFHSKAKTAGTAPVSYTFAKFVHKKKGMTPGKVLLSKENTLLVRPEIPKDCQLIND